MGMSKFMPIYEAIQREKTILGVGPMSFNTIDATIEISNEYKVPLILIASRRQVECSDYGGGYVTDTRTFAEYVRKRNTNGLIFLARDHGGPWQGTDESELNYFYAMESARKSYYADIESGFDIIHIDPSLRARPLKEIIGDVQSLYQDCEQYAKEFGRDIIYEVGTEEHSGNIHDLESFENFVKEVKICCPKVRFVVGNTGLWVKEQANFGSINEDHTKKMVEICNKNEVYLKAHNCDYLHYDTRKKWKQFGIHSANIAPEFGTAETKTLFSWANMMGYDNEAQKFYDIAYNSGKYIKWMVSDTPTRWKSGSVVGVNERQYKAEICGHYVFNHLEIKQIREKLNK
ncbi:MAG: tagatose-6-phosphate kinase, partial [Candidatus Parcubacteria bacterium]|nr:tagatose-6-phosphate kinase [Candidatus Parcubacteria bacterium]